MTECIHAPICNRRVGEKCILHQSCGYYRPAESDWKMVLDELIAYAERNHYAHFPMWELKEIRSNLSRCGLYSCPKCFSGCWSSSGNLRICNVCGHVWENPGEIVPVVAGGVCPECNGKGKIKTYLTSPFNNHGTTVLSVCQKCNGTGEQR